MLFTCSIPGLECAVNKAGVAIYPAGRELVPHLRYPKTPDRVFCSAHRDLGAEWITRRRYDLEGKATNPMLDWFPGTPGWLSGLIVRHDLDAVACNSLANREMLKVRIPPFSTASRNGCGSSWHGGWRVAESVSGLDDLLTKKHANVGRQCRVVTGRRAWWPAAGRTAPPEDLRGDTSRSTRRHPDANRLCRNPPPGRESFRPGASDSGSSRTAGLCRRDQTNTSGAPLPSRGEGADGSSPRT